MAHRDTRGTPEGNEAACLGGGGLRGRGRGRGRGDGGARAAAGRGPLLEPGRAVPADDGAGHQLTAAAAGSVYARFLMKSLV